MYISRFEIQKQLNKSSIMINFTCNDLFMIILSCVKPSQADYHNFIAKTHKLQISPTGLLTVILNTTMLSPRYTWENCFNALLPRRPQPHHRSKLFHFHVSNIRIPLAEYLPLRLVQLNSEPQLK